MNTNELREIAEYFLENHRDKITYMQLATTIEFDGDRQTSLGITIDHDDNDDDDLARQLSNIEGHNNG